MGSYFDKRFGPGWKERDGFFEDFEKELKESSERAVLNQRKLGSKDEFSPVISQSIKIYF